MLTLTLDEKDGHLLRVTASYLLALAAPVQAEATERDIANRVTLVHNQIVDEMAAPVFNETEIAQAADLEPTKAAEVFGKPPAVALSIVGAEASPIAPADTTETTLIPPPPTVQLPPVHSDASAANPAVQSTVSPASSVDLDVNRLPWDSRIHSREKTKLTSGAWKYKRGVPEKVVLDVETELRNLMAIPAAGGIATPPPLAPVDTVIAPPNTVVVPPPPTSTVATANPSSEPFPALMTKVAAAIAARKLNQQQVIAIVNGQGVPSLPGLIQRPDLIPNIEAAIDAQIMMNEVSGVAQ